MIIPERMRRGLFFRRFHDFVHGGQGLPDIRKQMLHRSLSGFSEKIANSLKLMGNFILKMRFIGA